MKNTSKKSKFVILPALATLVMTSVATVTGTAAWFTASRTATVSASQFESTSQSASMTVSASPLVGTKAGSTIGSVEADGKLTHGSYNAQKANAGDLFVASIDGDNVTNDNKKGEVTGYVSYGTVAGATPNSSGVTTSTPSKWAAEVGNTKIWYAVAWTMTFTMTDSSLNTNALFVDYNATTFKNGKTSIEAKETLHGFRIALMTDSNVRVVGGRESSYPQPTEKHVKEKWTKAEGDSDAKTHTEPFDDGIYHKDGSSLEKAIDAKADTLTTHKGYLGQFTNKSLTVTAVAWFEGEDESIVKDATMSNVTANLSFYSRQVLAA